MEFGTRVPQQLRNRNFWVGARRNLFWGHPINFSGRRGPMGMRSIGAEACSPFDPKPDLLPPRNSSQRRRALFFLPTALCAEVSSCGHFQRSRRRQGSGGNRRINQPFWTHAAHPVSVPSTYQGDASVIVSPTVLARPFSFVLRYQSLDREPHHTANHTRCYLRDGVVVCVFIIW